MSGQILVKLFARVLFSVGLSFTSSFIRDTYPFTSTIQSGKKQLLFNSSFLFLFFPSFFFLLLLSSRIILLLFCVYFCFYFFFHSFLLSLPVGSIVLPWCCYGFKNLKVPEQSRGMKTNQSK